MTDGWRLVARRGALGLFIALALTCACGQHEPAKTTEYRTTTTLGATCGDWQTSPAGAPGTRYRLNVACGVDLWCYGWTVAFPAENQLDDHFGVCLPDGEGDCLQDAASCHPLDALTCLVGLGEAHCYFRCSAHQDCPGPFQVCIDGGCTFETCPTTEGGVGGCIGGAHCENGICVPNG